ncbi:MAG TPA: hypothetical protein VLM05_08910 [Mycobacteriales bacterium]|nr:hypothetical protein [Mycobacteriales bacterium]
MSAGTDSRDEPFAAVLARVTEMAYRALRDYGEWRDDIAPDARLDADLGMQSIELAAFQGYLAQQWGAAADLSPLLRTLDLAGLADLSVGAVAGHVTARLAPAGPTAAGPAAPR